MENQQCQMLLLKKKVKDNKGPQNSLGIGD